MTQPRKLNEVSLPLEEINCESAGEKSIRHGHPSTPHVWWVPRPHTAARAVLFSQFIYEPSAHPERFPNAGDQERERLCNLIRWPGSGIKSALHRGGPEVLGISLDVVAEDYDGFDTATLRAVDENSRTLGATRARFEDS